MLASVFEQYAADSQNQQRAIQLIADLIAKIRPEKPHQVEAAVKAIQALCYLLHQDSAKAQLLRDAILQLLSERKPISLYLIARHSVFTGFFTELRRRISHKFLPEAVDTAYLIDLFALFFTKTTDARWVLAVPDAVWLELIDALRFDEAPSTLTQSCRQHMIAASQALSYRIAALGLEPELLRNYPELEKHTSPFIAQQEELAALFGQNTGEIDHILVMLDQCRAIVSKIRRNSVQTGTSIRLTNLLQRMSQQIARLETLLHILTKQSSATFETNANLEKVHLFKELVYSECHKNDVG